MVAVVGRLSPQKQPLILSEIAARLAALQPGDRWRLVVAGSGSLERALKKNLGEAGVGGQVVLAGWQDTPEDVFHAADVALLPSLWEGLPRSLIEAQAASLPIVASNIRGNREVVTEETGFLCEPQDASEYASRLSQLIESDVLRQRMGIAARRRAEVCFDSAVNNRRIIDVYEELLDGQTAPMPLARAA